MSTPGTTAELYKPQNEPPFQSVKQVAAGIFQLGNSLSPHLLQRGRDALFGKYWGGSCCFDMRGDSILGWPHF